MAKKALEAILGNGDTSELVDKKVDILNQNPCGCAYRYIRFYARL